MPRKNLMSWYSRAKLIKTAAAKAKIQEYSIASPSVKFFIYRYENLIPWDEMKKVKKSGGDVNSYIQQYISSNLMPTLKEKISGVDNPKDPSNNFMSPDFLEDQYVIQQIIHTEEANGMTPKGKYSDEIIKAARDMILHDVNNEKNIQFNEWWKYINEEEVYDRDPAFKYSVLKPIIDSSPPEKKDSPPPLNAEILADIWDKVVNKGVDQMDILKKYRKAAVNAEKKKAEKEGVEITGGDGNWIRIKGGTSVKNSSELKENIKRLKNLSQGTQWCTASGMADVYLPKGDFYLYLDKDKDKPDVAIRCVGNKVAEIRGYNNEQKYLDPYWKEVIDFLKTTKLDYEDNSYYKLLKKIERKNVNLVEGSDIFYEILSEIKANHKEYLSLSDENKQKFPIFRKTAAAGYGRELNKNLSEIEDKIGDDSFLFMFDNFQEKYDNIPPEIRAELPDMSGRVIQIYKRAYNNNPSLFSEFPPEIQKAFSPEEQRSGWFKYVDSDPYHYNDPRIPLEIKKIIPLAPLKNRWKELIANNSDHLDYINKNILAIFDPGEIEHYVLQDFANFPAATVGGRLVKLERVERFINEGKINRQEVINILANEIRKNPNNTSWIKRFPQEYQNEVMGQTNVQTIVDKSNVQYILENPGYFKSLSPEIQDSLLGQYGGEIGEAFNKTLSKYVGLYHNFWTSVPAKVRPYLPYETIDATAQFYANELNKNPNNQDELIKLISPDIQPFVFSKLSYIRRN